MRLHKNIYINKLIKITYIPLAWINIILTFSPIVFLFSIIITVLYYYKYIVRVIKKYFFNIIFIILFLFSSFIILLQNNTNSYEELFLMRIVNTVTHMTSFEDFIDAEESLATRVVSYINEFQIFVHYPLTGVGFGNLNGYMLDQLLKSPVSLTPELITKNKLSSSLGGGAMYNEGFMYTLLAENGIFAYLILAYFYYMTIKNINKSLKLYNLTTFRYNLAKSLFYTFISFLILSIYNLSLLSLSLHLLIALSAVFIYDFKVRLLIRKEMINEKNIYDR